MAVQWFIARSQQKIGPFSSLQLKQLADCGFLQPHEFLWVEGATKWIEARSIPGMFPTSEETKYWAHVGGQTRGPYVAEQVQAGLTTRQFTHETQVYSEKTKTWVPVAQMKEFRDYVPSTVSHSQAQLLAGSLDIEEAKLYLAGKDGDVLAELMAVLMEQKRKHAKNSDLVENLDRSISMLRSRREQVKANQPQPPE